MKDKDGKTALMRSTYNELTDSVKALLGAGANVNVKDNDGRTALMYAIGPYSGHDRGECMKELLAAGVNVNMKDKEGNTALMLATRHNCTKCEKLLR